MCEIGLIKVTYIVKLRQIYLLTYLLTYLFYTLKSLKNESIIALQVSTQPNNFTCPNGILAHPS